jgi:GPH family glycoside/pentoside/hexuronide:cation symporter
MEEPEAISPVGARRTAAVLAAISFAAFLCPVLFVRERFDAAHAKPSTPPIREILGTLRNRVFLFYFAAFCIFMTGYLAAQRVLVHWSIVGLDGDEGTVASLMLPFILTAVLSATIVAPLLARWFTPKWLLFSSFAIIATGLPLMWPIGTLDASSETKIRLGALLFAYTGIGQGIQYVVIWPLIGQVIDLDERQTGERREAVYQGMSGIAFKFGQAAAIIIATQSMTWFGYSADEPWGIYLVGPIAGVIGIAGLVVVWYYPDLHRNNAAEEGARP